MGRKLAFYAPLKSPRHPTPSGDRRMARALIHALERKGHEVELASGFRSFDREGDAERQGRVEKLGRRLANRLIKRYFSRAPASRPTGWITYHAYHKSPDWLGPAVAAALGIPYLLIETSFAGKQAGGPWDRGHRRAEKTIRRADVVLALTDVDLEGLAPLVEAPSLLKKFPPFLDPTPFQAAAMRRESHRRDLAARFDMDITAPWLLTVAMMRDDVKKLSYELLGQALRSLLDRPWQLLVAGGGPSLPVVEKTLSPLGSGRVRMAGILNEQELAACYAASDGYAWPAVREAYGLAMLEAQASGLPVVAGDEGGVSEVIRDAETGLLTPPRDPDAFALALADLLDHPDKRRAMGLKASRFAERCRSLEGASTKLDQALSEARDIFKARQAGRHERMAR